MVHRLVKSPLVLLSHCDAQSKLTHCLILLLALPPPDVFSLYLRVHGRVCACVCLKLCIHFFKEKQNLCP